MFSSRLSFPGQNRLSLLTVFAAPGQFEIVSAPTKAETGSNIEIVILALLYFKAKISRTFARAVTSLGLLLGCSSHL